MECLKDMAVNKFRKPSIFIKGKVCYKLYSSLMVNAEKWGENPQIGGSDANLLSLNFCMLLAMSSQLSEFLKLCIINTLVNFLLCYSCSSVRNTSLGGPLIPFLGLIKRF